MRTIRNSIIICDPAWLLICVNDTEGLRAIAWRLSREKLGKSGPPGVFVKQGKPMQQPIDVEALCNAKGLRITEQRQVFSNAMTSETAKRATKPRRILITTI